VTATIETTSLAGATAAANQLLTIVENSVAASLTLGVIVVSMTTPTITIPLAPLPALPPALPPQPSPPLFPAPPVSNATIDSSGTAQDATSAGERFALVGGIAGFVSLFACFYVFRNRLFSGGQPMSLAERQVHPRAQIVLRPTNKKGSSSAVEQVAAGGETTPPRVHAQPQIQAAPHVHARPQVQGQAAFVQTTVHRTNRQGTGARNGELRTGSVVRRAVEPDMVVDEVTDEGWSSGPSEVTPAWQKRNAEAAAAAAAAAAERKKAAQAATAQSKPATPQEVADDLLAEALFAPFAAAPAPAASSKVLNPGESIDELYAAEPGPGSAPPSAPGMFDAPGGTASKGAFVVRRTDKPISNRP